MSEQPQAGQAIDVGLFVLRIGIGIMFMVHGFPKLMGGPELWAKLGGAMGVFGITFAPTFWGLMAALAEGAGGLCLILGLGVRLAAGFMAFTMLVATLMHVNKGDGFNVYSHAAEMGIVFLALTIAGGGRLALGARIPFLAGRWFQ
jgi:putative oxidoreductase